MRIEIIERLSKLPNLTNRLEALKASDKFSDIGEVLSPVIIATKIENDYPISKQVQPIAQEERKHLREKLHDSGAEVLAFFGGNGNADVPEPAPAPVLDPLICTHCGAKLKPNWTKCANCGAPVMPQQKQPIIPAWIKPHQMKPLDFFAGAVVFVMWIAATMLIINSFGLGPWTIIGLGIFWLVFVVVYRVVAGGILD
jgi:ribosomal protein L40E